MTNRIVAVQFISVLNSLIEQLVHNVCVGMCDCEKAKVFCAHKHRVVRAFCSWTHTGIVLPFLSRFVLFFLREAVKAFPNVQSLSHRCAAVASPSWPNFDLHPL